MTPQGSPFSWDAEPWGGHVFTSATGSDLDAEAGCDE